MATDTTSMTLTGGGRDAAFGAFPSELLQATANKQLAPATLRIITFRRRFIGLQPFLEVYRRSKRRPRSPALLTG